MSRVPPQGAKPDFEAVGRGRARGLCAAASRARRAGLGAGLAGLLAMQCPRPARADGAVSYKYEDYRETGGRIGVTSQSAQIEQDLGADVRLRLKGVIDAIAGATPNGQPAPVGGDQVALTTLHKRRKEWDGDLSRQWANVGLTLGFAHSQEPDYLSSGLSLNVLTDFNEKNTTLLTGVGGNDDQVKVFYQAPWAGKRARDAVLGLTQLLDPLTSVTLNVSWERDGGYLNDQYKLVQKTLAVAPGVFLPFTFSENRPGERTRWVFLAELNRAWKRAGGALDASYRFYRDTFGVDAHTAELDWLQHVGEKVILVPSLRLYRQSAAHFYHYDLDATAIAPVAGPPRPEGPFYASDYRLSEMATSTVGFKVVLTLASRLQCDLAYERYQMRGRDGVTPQSAYPRANIVRAGASFTW